MLKIAWKRGLYRPVVECDWCEEPITDARDGNFEWQVAEDGDTDAAMLFTHKKCCHPFELANRGGGFWRANELQLLPLQLELNLRVDRRRAARLARLLAEVG